MATLTQWIEGARLRTLPLAVSPILVGTGAAASLHTAKIPEAVLALVVSLALQIGVNYANDYSDGIRGSDDNRVGPFRLTGSGATSPASVRNAAFIFFGVAALAGLLLIVLSKTWWLLAVGVAAILAAWFYTGGKKPYGYHGLGEVFVFLFFGLVATLGTTFTQSHEVNGPAVLGACAIGFLACALLMANNLRDIPTDTEAGKRTLAVMLGDKRARIVFTALVAAAFLCVVPMIPGHPWSALAFIALILAYAPVRTVSSGATGKNLIPVLKYAGFLSLGFGALLCLGLILSSL